MDRLRKKIRKTIPFSVATKQNTMLTNKPNKGSEILLQ
jgi:hypothetical protein